MRSAQDVPSLTNTWPLRADPVKVCEVSGTTLVVAPAAGSTLKVVMMFAESRRGRGMKLFSPPCGLVAPCATGVVFVEVALAAIEPDSPTVAQVTATAADQVSRRPAPREPEAELLLREINLISPPW
ncbi:hypothetical protein Mame01_46850 [Microbispora amethystogenes]|nr:hypothetical protein Mame01_46850 [Microbispora amethystogenes]